jgi:beta-N-acetylhexosaminidase
MRRAFFTGLAGPRLLDDERRFLADARPAGLILFGRNIETPDQVRRLVADGLDAIGTDSLVLIDQEGGRVQRLRPPQWLALPAAAEFAGAAVDPVMAVRLACRLIAEDLRALGITCNCSPVLDIPAPGSHDVIGTRAYGRDVETVVRLGRAAIAGFKAGGVVPVIKHMPGHGRTDVDTHHALPTVTADRATLEAVDFAPFKTLAADAPAGMTGHLIFTAIDSRAPASTSAIVHREIIRAHIGFDGLLMSDDLSMEALGGASIGARAAAVIAAGTDVALYCHGRMPEMIEVAAAAPILDGRGLERFERALAVTRDIQPFDRREAEAVIAAMRPAIA